MVIKYILRLQPQKVSNTSICKLLDAHTTFLYDWQITMLIRSLYQEGSMQLFVAPGAPQFTLVAGMI